VLRELGRPIAYYPYLSRYVGGVNACVLFCQLFYWQDKATSELGVHKTSEELQYETGLSYEEQRAARAALRASGVLVETSKRIEHKIYFRIDEDALERLLAGGVPVKKKAVRPKSKKAAQAGGKSPSPEMGKVHFGKPEKSTSGDGESPVGEMEKPDSANQEIPGSPTGQSLVRGQGDSQVVNNKVITTETTAATRERARPVDNSGAAAAAFSKDDKPATESELTELLIALELERGKTLAVDRSRDRVHVLTWVGNGVTLAQLREAHRLAAAARKRDSDDRPTYAGFVAPFVEQALAAPAAPTAQGAEPGEWFKTEAGVLAKAVELAMREPKPKEHWHSYRVHVVKLSREPRAVEFVLADAQRFNNSDLYQFAREIFGAALMPVDDYAS
jgi:hypothetical protein